MSEHVYKVVELVGSSEESVTKAIDRAIDKASQTIRHIGWFEVVQVRGHVEKGKVAQYQVTIKAGFRLEESCTAGGGRRGSHTSWPKDWTLIDGRPAGISLISRAAATPPGGKRPTGLRRYRVSAYANRRYTIWRAPRICAIANVRSGRLSV